MFENSLGPVLSQHHTKTFYGTLWHFMINLRVQFMYMYLIQFHIKGIYYPYLDLHPFSDILNLFKVIKKNLLGIIGKEIITCFVKNRHLCKYFMTQLHPIHIMFLIKYKYMLIVMHKIYMYMQQCSDSLFQCTVVTFFSNLVL